jgi:hypothetical protein
MLLIFVFVLVLILWLLAFIDFVGQRMNPSPGDDQDSIGGLVGALRLRDRRVVVPLAIVLVGLAWQIFPELLLASESLETAMPLTLTPTPLVADVPATPTLMPTPTATASPKSPTTPRIVIADVVPGMEDEYIVLVNFSERLSLHGWTIRDKDGNSYHFDSFVLPGSSAVRIHSSAGQDTENDLYWGSNVPIWDPAGDTAVLMDRFSYVQ